MEESDFAHAIWVRSSGQPAALDLHRANTAIAAAMLWLPLTRRRVMRAVTKNLAISTAMILPRSAIFVRLLQFFVRAFWLAAVLEQRGEERR